MKRVNNAELSEKHFNVVLSQVFDDFVGPTSLILEKANF